MKGKILRSYTVSTISIALVLFVLGGIGYTIYSLFSSAHTLREGVVMLVELKDSVTEEQRDSLQSQISSKSLVASVGFVSKEAKLEDKEFRRAFDVDIEGILGENPLPDSFDVTLTAKASDSAALMALVEQIKALDGIAHVSYPEELLSQVHSVLDTMQLLMLLFGGAMLIISLVLLNNTVRLTIISHREAIKTMKLVGATKWFITKPFIARSAVQGLIAGIVATLLFGGAMFGIDHTLPQLGIAAQIELLAIIAATMVVAGVVTAVVSTWITVAKFVNMKSNKIYLY